MKRVIFALAILLTFACSKTEVSKTPPLVVVQEEVIKYTLALNNISASSILEADSLNFGINITSKLPKDGVSLTLSIKRLDSNITIWSKDTIVNSSSLSFNINKITIETDYTIYSTVTSKTTPTNTSSVTSNFNRNIPTIYTATKIPLSINSHSNNDIQTAMDGSVSGTIYYVFNGIEHIVIPGTLFFRAPLTPIVHLIKKNNIWQLENYYPEAAMGAGRNYEKIGEGEFVFSDHGLELSQGTWPRGDIWLMKTIGEKLQWTKVSKTKSFYHSVSSGDLNGDGRLDFIGLHMGTNGDWGDNLHPYTQSSDGVFSEARNFISYDKLQQFDNKWSAGAVLITSLFNNSSPEIIRGAYGHSSAQKNIYGFAIFSFNNFTKQYEVSYLPSNIGAFASTEFGSTSIKVTDVNKDGKKDLIFAGEGNNYMAIQVFLNNGKNEFNPGQLISYTNNEMQFREFNLVDYDKDGDEDIILNPFHFGTQFRFGGSGTNKGNGIVINNLILNNNGGNFSPLKKSIKIDGIYPAHLKGFMINGKLKFIGLQGNNDGSLTIFDITPGV
jgi:hypothetical protein